MPHGCHVPLHLRLDGSNPGGDLVLLRLTAVAALRPETPELSLKDSETSSELVTDFPAMCGNVSTECLPHCIDARGEVLCQGCTKVRRLGLPGGALEHQALGELLKACQGGPVCFLHALPQLLHLCILLLAVLHEPVGLRRGPRKPRDVSQTPHLLANFRPLSHDALTEQLHLPADINKLCLQLCNSRTVLGSPNRSGCTSLPLGLQRYGHALQPRVHLGDDAEAAADCGPLLCRTPAELLQAIQAVGEGQELMAQGSHVAMRSLLAPRRCLVVS
mmetsp:Transcript_36588/g.101560  ORF Transcript_36588/g.101560 Transcript_36588/m.101560 type:complete len:275 (+) Transcript_36588:1341-2165(+)